MNRLDRQILIFGIPAAIALVCEILLIAGIHP